MEELKRLVNAAIDTLFAGTEEASFTSVSAALPGHLGPSHANIDALRSLLDRQPILVPFAWKRIASIEEKLTATSLRGLAVLLRILVPGSVLPGEGAVGDAIRIALKETILIPLLRQEADSEYLGWETTLFLLLAGVLKKNSNASDGSTTSNTDVMNHKGSTSFEQSNPEAQTEFVTKVLARVDSNACLWRHQIRNEVRDGSTPSPQQKWLQRVVIALSSALDAQIDERENERTAIDAKRENCRTFLDGLLLRGADPGRYLNTILQNLKISLDERLGNNIKSTTNIDISTPFGSMPVTPRRPLERDAKSSDLANILLGVKPEFGTTLELEKASNTYTLSPYASSSPPHSTIIHKDDSPSCDDGGFLRTVASFAQAYEADHSLGAALARHLICLDKDAIRSNTSSSFSSSISMSSSKESSRESLVFASMPRSIYKSTVLIANAARLATTELCLRSDSSSLPSHHKAEISQNILFIAAFSMLVAFGQDAESGGHTHPFTIHALENNALGVGRMVCLIEEVLNDTAGTNEEKGYPGTEDLVYTIVQLLAEVAAASSTFREALTVDYKIFVSSADTSGNELPRDLFWANRLWHLLLLQRKTVGKSHKEATYCLKNAAAAVIRAVGAQKAESYVSLGASRSDIEEEHKWTFWVAAVLDMLKFLNSENHPADGGLGQSKNSDNFLVELVAVELIWRWCASNDAPFENIGGSSASLVGSIYQRKEQSGAIKSKTMQRSQKFHSSISPILPRLVKKNHLQTQSPQKETLLSLFGLNNKNNRSTGELDPWRVGSILQPLLEQPRAALQNSCRRLLLDTALIVSRSHDSTDVSFSSSSWMLSASVASGKCSRGRALHRTLVCLLAVKQIEDAGEAVQKLLEECCQFRCMSDALDIFASLSAIFTDKANSRPSHDNNRDAAMQWLQHKLNSETLLSRSSSDLEIVSSGFYSLYHLIEARLQFECSSALESVAYVLREAIESARRRTRACDTNISDDDRRKQNEQMPLQNLLRLVEGAQASPLLPLPGSPPVLPPTPCSIQTSLHHQLQQERYKELDTFVDSNILASTSSDVIQSIRAILPDTTHLRQANVSKADFSKTRRLLADLFTGRVSCMDSSWHSIAGISVINESESQPIAGNDTALNGINISTCFEHGLQVAQDICEYLLHPSSVVYLLTTLETDGKVSVDPNLDSEAWTQAHRIRLQTLAFVAAAVDDNDEIFKLSLHDRVTTSLKEPSKDPKEIGLAISGWLNTCLDPPPPLLSMMIPSQLGGDFNSQVRKQQQLSALQLEVVLRRLVDDLSKGMVSPNLNSCAATIVDLIVADTARGNRMAGRQIIPEHQSAINAMVARFKSWLPNQAALRRLGQLIIVDSASSTVFGSLYDSVAVIDPKRLKTNLTISNAELAAIPSAVTYCNVVLQAAMNTCAALRPTFQEWSFALFPCGALATWIIPQLIVSCQNDCILSAALLADQSLQVSLHMGHFDGGSILRLWRQATMWLLGAPTEVADSKDIQCRLLEIADALPVAAAVLLWIGLTHDAPVLPTNINGIEFDARTIENERLFWSNNVVGRIWNQESMNVILPKDIPSKKYDSNDLLAELLVVARGHQSLNCVQTHAKYGNEQSGQCEAETGWCVVGVRRKSYFLRQISHGQCEKYSEYTSSNHNEGNAALLENESWNLAPVAGLESFCNSSMSSHQHIFASLIGSTPPASLSVVIALPLREFICGVLMPPQDSHSVVGASSNIDSPESEGDAVAFSLWLMRLLEGFYKPVQFRGSWPRLLSEAIQVWLSYDHKNERDIYDSTRVYENEIMAHALNLCLPRLLAVHAIDCTHIKGVSHDEALLVLRGLADAAHHTSFSLSTYLKWRAVLSRVPPSVIAACPAALFPGDVDHILQRGDTALKLLVDTAKSLHHQIIDADIYFLEMARGKEEASKYLSLDPISSLLAPIAVGVLAWSEVALKLSSHAHPFNCKTRSSTFGGRCLELLKSLLKRWEATERDHCTIPSRPSNPLSMSLPLSYATNSTIWAGIETLARMYGHIDALERFKCMSLAGNSGDAIPPITSSSTCSVPVLHVLHMSQWQRRYEQKQQIFQDGKRKRNEKELDNACADNERVWTPLLKEDSKLSSDISIKGEMAMSQQTGKEYEQEEPYLANLPSRQSRLDTDVIGDDYRLQPAQSFAQNNTGSALKQPDHASIRSDFLHYGNVGDSNMKGISSAQHQWISRPAVSTSKEETNASMDHRNSDDISVGKKKGQSYLHHNFDPLSAIDSSQNTTASPPHFKKRSRRSEK